LPSLHAMPDKTWRILRSHRGAILVLAPREDEPIGPRTKALDLDSMGNNQICSFRGRTGEFEARPCKWLRLLSFLAWYCTRLRVGQERALD